MFCTVRNPTMVPFPFGDSARSVSVNLNVCCTLESPDATKIDTSHAVSSAVRSNLEMMAPSRLISTIPLDAPVVPVTVIAVPCNAKS